MTLYLNLATLLGQRIETGLYLPGQRLPSVRTLSLEHGVSLSTVQQAYRVLEDLGLAVPRPKSGYFVSPTRRQMLLPASSRPAQRPVEVCQWDQVLELMRTSSRPDTLQLGSGTPDIAAVTLKPLFSALNQISRRHDLAMLRYDNIQGLLELRQQVARLALDSGCRLLPEDIVITTGCHEALSAAVRALCKPGEIMAVESPGFHGIMQTLKGANVQAIEIPTDPVTGISLEALELALEQWPVRAILVTPSCNNPIGFTMPDERKQRLLRLAQRFDTPIIEDDIYGDLAYGYPRPSSIKSMDKEGRVLLCSSFSKTLAPGLRVGWIAPGRYLEQVLHMKYIGTGATATHTQMAVAEFIAKGFYQPHLRRVRGQYQRNRDRVIRWISQYFPEDTRVSQPQGGFMLWVELSESVDTLRLNRLLTESSIQIAVGSIFSAVGKYRNCLRINYACVESAAMEEAIRCIAQSLNSAQTVHNCHPTSQSSG
ncbi:DNA-binding transcriptional MocR family regulator [Pseudomonas duriflava]|uniref:DNA-binding transcriptional MocR family regulator n=1 Tax=Pseudomonas duriflava TaxID=459528 RepID=A0A562PX21_9PSED|nr:PLP-dependent aminotransferase family protein [Pseudomonas duriflava]TWI48975.1 DNA-binding transcriptional MocR family regulator [Pseudomonas duriflava]